MDKLNIFYISLLSLLLVLTLTFAIYIQVDYSNNNKSSAKNTGDCETVVEIDETTTEVEITKEAGNLSETTLEYFVFRPLSVPDSTKKVVRWSSTSHVPVMMPSSKTFFFLPTNNNTKHVHPHVKLATDDCVLLPDLSCVFTDDKDRMWFTKHGPLSYSEPEQIPFQCQFLGKTAQNSWYGINYLDARLITSERKVHQLEKVSETVGTPAVSDTMMVARRIRMNDNDEQLVIVDDLRNGKSTILPVKCPTALVWQHNPKGDDFLWYSTSTGSLVKWDSSTSSTDSSRQNFFMGHLIKILRFKDEKTVIAIDIQNRYTLADVNNISSRYSFDNLPRELHLMSDDFTITTTEQGRGTTVVVANSENVLYWAELQNGSFEIYVIQCSVDKNTNYVHIHSPSGVHFLEISNKVPCVLKSALREKLTLKK